MPGKVPEGVVEARVVWIRARIVRDPLGRLEDILAFEGNVSLAGLPADRVAWDFREAAPEELDRTSWVSWREFRRLQREAP